MKKIKTVDAVGHILCHDLTRIVKDEMKDVAFKKGHIVREEDIEVLLSMGKDNLYIWEKSESMFHENEAAEVLASVCQNEFMIISDVKEGKIDLFADCDGLFTVDVDKLLKINTLGEIIIATRHTNYPVKKGELLASTRIIPLMIEKEKIQKILEICDNEKILSIHKYRKMKVGVVTTGGEVYYGRIKDTFTPVIIQKLLDYGSTVEIHKVVCDKKEMIIDAIKEMREKDVDMVVCTGGMSVDPDDVTPTAIKECGANLVSYGAPILPGSMFLLAYFNDRMPVLGLPGCVMYSKITIFDLILPRVLAGVTITKFDLASMGHGGLCFKCPKCTYPSCEFGKGS